MVWLKNGSTKIFENQDYIGIFQMSVQKCRIGIEQFV